MRITITGLSACEARIASLEGAALQNTLRRAVRAGAKPFVAAIQTVAGSVGVPRSFRKVPAPRVSTRGGISGREITASVRPKSPLFNIYEPGAKRHTIAPRRKGALGGPAGSGSWDSAGRKRGQDFFSAGPVEHPGMAAHPILAVAFAMAEGAASIAFADAIFGRGPEPLA